MKSVKLLLMYVIIGGVFLSVILHLITVVTDLNIKTLEKQKLEWQVNTAKKDNKLVDLQIQNELTRYRVYKTMEGKEE